MNVVSLFLTSRVWPLSHNMLRAVLLTSLICVSSGGWCAHATETLPPKPRRHFNDYANVVSPQRADFFNKGLVGFQNSTTNEVLVVIYPTLPTASSLEDYCTRLAASWHLGHPGLDNGIVLFVFVQDRQARIEVRPGLEGALPDAKAKDIAADAIAPKFRAGDFDGGLTEGIAAIFKETEYEYDAEEVVAADNAHGQNAWTGWDTFFLVADLLIVLGLGALVRRKLRHWRAQRTRAASVAAATVLVIVCGGSARVNAAEFLPAKPARYCNDSTHLLRPETVRQLDRGLEGHERATSNQVVVALYRSLRSSAPLEDYCQRLAASWHVGQTKANGVVLFYFARENKFYIEVRPGLQSVLSDTECQRIIAERILPWIKANDFDGALVHGVAAILADTQNAYQSTLRRADWLRPVSTTGPWRFRDYLAPFFGLSVIVSVFWVIFSVLSTLGEELWHVIRNFFGGRTATTIQASSSVARGTARKLHAPPPTAPHSLRAEDKHSDKKTSSFWDTIIALAIIAGLVAVVIIGIVLWRVYLNLDRNPFLVVTAAGLCCIVFLPAWFVRSHWEIFADEKNPNEKPPPFWKIAASIVGILVAIVIGGVFWIIFGLIGAILSGGVFAVFGFLLGLGGSALSGGGGSSFGGGGGASSSW